MKSVFGLQWEVRFIKQPAITVSNPACCLQKSSLFFQHPFLRHLVKQGVYLSAGSLGTTWPFLHRPTRGESDDVKFGHNELSGLRHMGKVGHKVWNRCLFDANKFVFRRVAAFIRTFQLPADRDLQTRLNKNTFHVTTDRFRRYFPFSYSVFDICFLFFFLLRFLRAASPSSGRRGT